MPVLASKSSTNLLIVALIGSGERRVISLWARARDGMASARVAITMIERGGFKTRTSYVPVIRLRPAAKRIGDEKTRTLEKHKGAAPKVQNHSYSGALSLLHVFANPIVDEFDDHIAVPVEEHFVHIAVDPDVFEAHKLVLYACLIEPFGNANVEHTVIGTFGGDGQDAHVLQAHQFMHGLLLHVAGNFIRPVRFFFEVRFQIVGAVYRRIVVHRHVGDPPRISNLARIFHRGRIHDADLRAPRLYRYHARH